MFEIFKFVFVVWLVLNSKEENKRKGIRNLGKKRKGKEAWIPSPFGLLAHPAHLARPLPPPRSLYRAGPPYLHSRAPTRTPLSLCSWAQFASPNRAPVPPPSGPRLPIPPPFNRPPERATRAHARRDGRAHVTSCHTRFWKVNRMRTMCVPGLEIHVHSDYINDSS
jgi:hypothetical protein